VANLHLRGAALEALGQGEAAEQSYRAGWALADEILGAASIPCADIDFDLGLLLLDSETGLTEGLERIERARGTYARVYSATSSRVAMVDLALANHALLTGDLDKAQTLAKRALDALPPGHRDRSWALDAYAVIQMNRGNIEASERALDEAIENHIGEGRSTHSDLAFMLTQRGELRVQQERFDDALSDFEDATAIFEQSRDPGHPDWAYLLLGVGNARLGLGEAKEAWQAFDRAQGLIQSADSDRGLRAHVAWGCARALRALNERPEESRGCAETAKSLLTELDPQNPLIPEIDAFLES